MNVTLETAPRGVCFQTFRTVAAGLAHIHFSLLGVGGDGGGLASSWVCRVVYLGPEAKNWYVVGM